MLERTAQISNFERGDIFVINGRAAGIGRYFWSENITFDHLTAYACPGALFVGSQTSQLNVLNCKGLLKAGRFITSGGDGVHCQSARIGPWIEHCEFEGLSDDCLNVYSVPTYILEKISPTEMKIRARVPFAPGDSLAFFSPKTGKVQETTVVSFSENRLTVSDPIGKLNLAPEGTRLDLRGWKIYDHIYNVSCIGNGFVCRDNFMHDGRRFGGFIKASYGLIENNRFEGLSGSALRVANEPDWPEGFWAHNLIIQNNTVSDCGYSKTVVPVVIRGEKIKGLLPPPFHRNIFLVGNEIEAISGPAASFSGIENLIMKDNRFSNEDRTKPLIKLQRSKNVIVEDNRGANHMEISNMDAEEVHTQR